MQDRAGQLESPLVQNAPSPNVEVPPGPHAEYSRRLADRGRRAARAEAMDRRLSFARGIVFLAGLALVALALATGAFSFWWSILPAVVLLLLIAVHSPVADRLTRARRAVAYYQACLDRLDERWAGKGTDGARYTDPSHPYAGDLDIFGRGSLFELISTARTRLGEDRLAAWLSAPADRETILARHAAVDELRGQLDLREKLALLDAEVHDHFDQNRLLQWCRQTPRPVPDKFRLLAVFLAAAALAAVAAWPIFGPAPFAAVLMLEVVFTFAFRSKIRELAHTANEAASGLAILSQVLGLMEREQCQTPRLAAILARLETEGRPPSRRIAKLDNFIQSLNNALQNQFFAPIALLLCLPIHLIHAIERWRERFASHIPGWLESVAEFEALSALAAYAYEHPDDPFPEIAAGGPSFEGEQIGHPLIPAHDCVRNDLTLCREKQMLLVSGSNMSGKSTLLRTVGANAVLALAGAPVRAGKLRISPMNVGTAMRVNDSLLDGKSLFYASLSRLKTIVELARQPLPLLFLLDEILQGTNSHDRRLGAEGVIRQLLDSGAIGLVTTHDLALTEIVESLGQKAENVHFEDRLSDGRMTFDYRLRPGVVQRSNALELMRLMGLTV
jgi:hypothetical protein